MKTFMKQKIPKFDVTDLQDQDPLSLKLQYLQFEIHIAFSDMTQHPFPFYPI